MAFGLKYPALPALSLIISRLGHHEHRLNLHWNLHRNLHRNLH